MADSLGIVMDLDPTAQKLTDPTGFGSKKNNESRKVQVVLGFTVPDYGTPVPYSFEFYLI